MHRLEDCDDLLQRGVQPALRELLLELGGGQRIWGTERSYGRYESGRAVGTAVSPRLRHRLDEGDLDALPVEGPYESEARPGQAYTRAGRHEQQATDHDIPPCPLRARSATGDHLDGIASDHQLFVRGDDERYNRASKTDTPARVPAVVGI